MWRCIIYIKGVKMANFRTYGKTSAKLIRELYNQNKYIFVIKDVQGILMKTHNEAADLLAKLVKRNIVARLKAGKFMIIPQEAADTENYIGNWYVAAREVVNTESYYVGFYSAMQFWGMLTQPLVKMFVGTTKRQFPFKEMKDKFIFVFIGKKNYWGYREEWVTNTEKVKITDIEKTIIDALAHPEYCGGITEIAKAIWIVKDRLDQNKLKEYVQRYNKNVVGKRLGYVMEILEIGDTELLTFLKTYVKDRYDKFDPSGNDVRINKNRWKIIDNVGRDQIKNLVWS